MLSNEKQTEWVSNVNWNLPYSEEENRKTEPIVWFGFGMERAVLKASQYLI